MSKNKFSAIKEKRMVGTQVYEFDSKAEARHFDYLLNLFKAGEITNLSVQPEFKLTESFELTCSFTQSKKTTIGGMTYTPDFRYEREGLVVVDEVKGKVTTDYRMRLKLFLADAGYKHKVDIFNEIILGKKKTYYCSGLGSE